MIKFSALFLSLVSSTFAFADFPITQENAGLGVKETLTLEKDTVFHLTGNAIKTGQLMPSMVLTDSNLSSFDTSKNSGKVRIYSVITSVDTPVCEQQSVDLAKFIKSNKKKLQDIEFIVVSADTPFAQQRFIKENGLEKSQVTFLSDSIAHEFGNKTGSQIQELGLLARAIIVVDKNNKVSFVQRVPELTTIPDINTAIKAAKVSS
ncbi:thiol peroxidase [Endozoicomonas elysicola]|uniref:Thioredoxin peroxidase n=1 Tax=Endozoicomonas elysicola TaxID=305900 RepID=A0A081K614_9GAMM|nr:peroxiredoxin [Endozoicomonas elysicola]KEI69590.1 thioredoxin peroxidase [Endozoicomonas elysicola]